MIVQINIKGSILRALLLQGLFCFSAMHSFMRMRLSRGFLSQNDSDAMRCDAIIYSVLTVYSHCTVY